MQILTQPLDDAMQAEIETLRRAVQELLASDTTQPMPPRLAADRMLRRLEGWLLDDEQKQALSDQPWQLYFLHAACIINSASMHAGDRINHHWQQLSVLDSDRVAVLARILRQIPTSLDAPWTTDDAGPVPFAGSLIQTNLIAAGIHLASALELKLPATFQAIMARLPNGRADASMGLADTFDVDQIGPHPYFPATIQVKIRCRHPELHRALKHHERAVLEQLTNINQHIRPRFLFADVIYEIEPYGYQPLDLKFCVDSTAALQLFMGNRLYADKRVFLRELIQNAVDACSLRKLRDKAYSPAISIAFNDDISCITIRDNGIGMDRQWLEKYFLSIGISFYQSNEIKSVNRDPRIDIGFISQFGIGFLSSFLVAQKIVIKTRRESSTGLKITISSLKDYFDVRPLEDHLSTGTEVTLHLKPSRINYCRSLEFVGYLKTNIRFLQIPVRFTDERGVTSMIGSEPLSYAVQHSGHGDFVASVPFEDAEGYVYVAAKMHGSRMFALESATGGVSVFQDGIFVTQDDNLLPEGARQNVVGRINLRGRDKCELSMDRNRIFWAAGRKKQVRQTISLALADVANRVMEKLDRQGAPERTRRSVLNHLAIFFDFSEVDDALHDRLCDVLQQVVDKRFRDFVRVHFAHTRSAVGIPEADGYGEQWQRRILASFAPKN